jgi:hypothetical protein
MSRPEKSAKRKKPGPPRTTGKGDLVGVRILPPLLKRIDAWAQAQDDSPTRNEAIRRLTERGLERDE